ncbi:unnamed protein product [Owenia fusiformis]|uniref:TIR domain-containing protein n=1 Tax=Owenia fusiformis TaxID=6347 RepID=A0A8S4Q4L4_OWEFU|nr:unnamed protein product [Owenia fusiformis]
MAAETDVMVAYESADLEFVKWLTDKLEKAGLRVWYKGNPSDKSKLQGGEAVLSSKVVVFVLSEDSAVDKACRDEVSLAYISNRTVFPVGMKYFRKISPYLDGGLKLMLAKINWSFFVKKETFEENFTTLFNGIQHEIAKFNEKVASKPDTTDETGDIEIKDGEFRLSELLTTGNVEEMKDLKKDNEQKCDFWDRHFQDKTEAPWSEFREHFIEDYAERMQLFFTDEQTKWVINLIYKDIFELRKCLDRKLYDKFCGKNVEKDSDLFYNRLKDYAVGSFAMREVFNMESSVRMTAIKNLASYQTPGVIAALLELLEDADPNIRAVAALGLGKSGRKNRRVIDHMIKLLSDEDRLVRESACLSLGKMKTEKAVPHIIDLWRNDPIKHVREAAQVALSKVGGGEAAQAIKVTSVLSTEMEALRNSKRK